MQSDTFCYESVMLQMLEMIKCICAVAYLHVVKHLMSLLFVRKCSDLNVLGPAKSQYHQPPTHD